MELKGYNYERVMIIDDNKIDRYTASYVIQKNQFGKEILEFDMAAKALSFFQENERDLESLPDIILLDISMPEMDGFQFLEQLSRLPDSVKKRFSVVMLSSSLNPSDHEKAGKNPMVKTFLNKPLNKTSLEILGKLAAPLKLSA